MGGCFFKHSKYILTLTSEVSSVMVYFVVNLLFYQTWCQLSTEKKCHIKNDSRLLVGSTNLFKMLVFVLIGKVILFVISF